MGNQAIIQIYSHVRCVSKNSYLQNPIIMYQLLKEHIRKFISIPDQDLDSLTSFFTPRQLKKKDYLFRQNDQCRQLAFVNKGCLRNYHIDSHGEEQIVYFATEEWWVGDMQSFFLLLTLASNRNH